MKLHIIKYSKLLGLYGVVFSTPTKLNLDFIYVIRISTIRRGKVEY